MYNLNSLPQNLLNAIKILSTRYNFNISEKGRQVFAVHEEKDILKIQASEKEVKITYKDTPSFLRGMGLVLQNEKEGKLSFEKEEKIWFDFNGLMIDCSRNGVVNIPYAKEMIQQLAIAGQNVFMLYMEDTFKLDSEEYFGYLRGAYTKEELKDLDDYAYSLGVSLIPCVQTLAHLDQFFMWEEIAEKYSDIDNILNVSDSKVKIFLENMISYLASTFRSKRIHIGMDEAYNLGRGKYADKNGLKHKTEIMLEHLEFISKVCEKYGVRPIIWDDMFFSGYSKISSKDYKIPNGIDLMYWDYYNNTVPHYEENIEKRSKITNKKIMFAGGSWRWIGYASHHEKTLITTNSSLSACKGKGIREVITTAWADDGCESPVQTSLFGAILFAEHQYNEKVDLESFKKRLKFITKMDFENFVKPQDFDILPSMAQKAGTVTPSKYTLYEDPLCSKFINHTECIKDDLTNIYIKLAEYFESKALESEDEVLKATNKFYSSFGKVLSLKWNLGLNIFKAYKENDKNKLKAIIKDQLEPLIYLLEDLKLARMEEWYMTNKSFGFEVLDQRFGGLISRCKTTKIILERYLNGKIDIIEELEEKRLPATHHREGGMGEVLHYNRAQRCMTSNKMVW